MKIAYKIELEDIIAFNSNYMRNDPKMQKKLRRNRILIPAIYALVAASILILDPNFWPAAWLFGFLSIIWFLFYPQIWTQRIAKQVKKSYKQVNFQSKDYDYKLFFKPEGIQASKADHSHLIPWSKIISIEDTNNHLFLYFTKHDGLIIPKAKFLKNNSWNKIISIIKKLYSPSTH